MTSHEDFELKVMASQQKHSTGKIGTPPAEQIMEQVKAKIPGPSDEYKEAVFATLQKKSESKEQSDPFPAGWEYAPRSAKKHRHFLEDANDVGQMMRLQNIISYNADGTINFLLLKKTFCNDLSGRGETMDHANALALAELNGYTLFTDYNDCDTQIEKEQTDLYNIVSMFNPNGKIINGDATEARMIFMDMTGYKPNSWTATPYKGSNGEAVAGLFLIGHINDGKLDGHFDHDTSEYNVCGRKDMVLTK